MSRHTTFSVLHRAAVSAAVYAAGVSGRVSLTPIDHGHAPHGAPHCVPRVQIDYLTLILVADPRADAGARVDAGMKECIGVPVTVLGAGTPSDSHSIAAAFVGSSVCLPR